MGDIKYTPQKDALPLRPAPQAPARPRVKTPEARRDELEQAKAIMQRIAEGIKEEQSATMLLYDAVEAIGLLAEDPEWAEDAKSQLSPGAIQQIFAIESTEEDAAAILEQRAKLEYKTIKQMNSIIKQWNKLEQDASRILASIQTRQMIERTAAAAEDEPPLLAD